MCKLKDLVTLSDLMHIQQLCCLKQRLLTKTFIIPTRVTTEFQTKNSHKFSLSNGTYPGQLKLEIIPNHCALASVHSFVSIYMILHVICFVFFFCHCNIVIARYFKFIAKIRCSDISCQSNLSYSAMSFPFEKFRNRCAQK